MSPEIYQRMKLHLYCMSTRPSPALCKRYPRLFAERDPERKLWHFDPDISMGFTVGLSDTSLNRVTIFTGEADRMTSEFFFVKSRNKWNAAQHIYPILKEKFIDLDDRLMEAHQPVKQ